MRYFAITHPFNPGVRLYCTCPTVEIAIRAFGLLSTVLEITQHEYEMCQDTDPKACGEYTE